MSNRVRSTPTTTSPAKTKTTPSHTLSLRWQINNSDALRLTPHRSIATHLLLQFLVLLCTYMLWEYKQIRFLFSLFVQIAHCNFSSSSASVPLYRRLRHNVAAVTHNRRRHVDSPPPHSASPRFAFLPLLFAHYFRSAQHRDERRRNERYAVQRKKETKNRNRAENSFRFRSDRNINKPRMISCLCHLHVSAMLICCALFSYFKRIFFLLLLIRLNMNKQDCWICYFRVCKFVINRAKGRERAASRRSRDAESDICASSRFVWRRFSFFPRFALVRSSLQTRSDIANWFSGHTQQNAIDSPKMKQNEHTPFRWFSSSSR